MFEINKTVAETDFICLDVQAAADESAARTLRRTSKTSITRECLQAHYSIVLDLLYRFIVSNFSTYSNTFLILQVQRDGDSNQTRSPQVHRRAGNREWLAVPRRQNVSSGSSTAYYQERRWSSKTSLC